MQSRNRILVTGIGWALVVALAAPLVQAWSPEPVDSAPSVVIHVRKATREMWLQDHDQVVRRFNIVLGNDPSGGKLHRGDGRTPVGRYYISEKRPSSRFRRFLGISYPNIDDAERAFGENLINDEQWSEIFFANLNQMMPPQDTLLGGRVGIHGYGGRIELPIDWTQGCIAVSDSDIDYLYDAVPVGTLVQIDD